MMASTQKSSVPEVYRYYHCGSKSSDCSFKYFDNKKEDQPRYQCHQCAKLFTLEWHGRPQGRTYAKKHNEDPIELKSLWRQCCHCGVADNALFKYYNNRNVSQPRFKCLNCRKGFQMRLLGTGEERHLVHTSTQRTRAPRRQKQAVPKLVPEASSNFADGSYVYQPCNGSFLPVPCDPLMMPLEPSATLLPEMLDEDAQYVDFLNTELVGEENTQVDPFSWTANGEDGNLLPPWNDEAAAYLHLLKADLSTGPESNETPNVNASSSPTNVDGELPPTWSCNEDVEFIDFIETELLAFDVDPVSNHTTAEMVFESASNNAEVERPATPDCGSWIHDDTSMEPSSMSYADVAAPCCLQMNLDMACKKSEVAVPQMQSIGSECSLSSAGLEFTDSFHVIPEPLMVQQALTEDEQCFDSHWNEDDDAEDATEINSSWAY